MTQKDRILNHLQVYGRITPLEALERYGVMRLGARIWDLRHEGYSISTAPTSGTNRYGDAISYATYIYATEEDGSGNENGFYEAGSRGAEAHESAEKSV